MLLLEDINFNSFCHLTESKPHFMMLGLSIKIYPQTVWYRYYVNLLAKDIV